MQGFSPYPTSHTTNNSYLDSTVNHIDTILVALIHFVDKVKEKAAITEEPVLKIGSQLNKISSQPKGISPQKKGMTLAKGLIYFLKINYNFTKTFKKICRNLLIIFYISAKIYCSLYFYENLILFYRHGGRPLRKAIGPTVKYPAVASCKQQKTL